MQMIPFTKYQGTGNDFILIDNRRTVYLTRSDTERIEQMCDRRFGIGADGLILLQDVPGHDFEMVYFNADGRESTMCGNGGRCIAAFAKQLGIIGNTCLFLAIDGPHSALVRQDGIVELKMSDVSGAEVGEGRFILNTGSPHCVVFVEEVGKVNVVESGRAIRYGDRFRQKGINVNFVEQAPNGISVATYERGVEDETLSCGTGVTAAALSWALFHEKKEPGELPVRTKGGNLTVRYRPDGLGGFTDVWLCGPAVRVFEGVV